MHKLKANILAVLAVMTVPALYLTTLGAANSPVADAAMHGDAAAVSRLIAAGEDVNAPQADGATALQWAAYQNNMDVARELVDAGADVHKKNRNGVAPIQLAAERGSPEMLTLLLDKGANANELNPNGETPVMYAARNGNTEAIQVLLDHGALVNVAEYVRGTTPLMWAVDQAHPEAVKMLVNAGADVTETSKLDTKGARAYLAPSVAARLRQDRVIRARLKSKSKGDSDFDFSNFDFAAFAKGQAKGKGKGKGKGKEGEDIVSQLDAAALAAAFGVLRDTDGGELTPLVYAAKSNCIECAQILLDANAPVDQQTNYGWTALLTATQNRHYKLGELLLENGADPNIRNHGGWSPLYLATDNRNIEKGDYPVPQPDMDHLEFIKALIDHGADVNIRVCGTKSTQEECIGDSTETRTNFTMQWLEEDGATPFLRAAQSSDVELMKLLLEHGADPKIYTRYNVTPLAVASGIAWVEGVTYEWSEAENVEAVKMLLDLGIDPNIQDRDGRTSLHGAAHKGRNDVVQLLVDAGGDLTLNDFGSRDTIAPERRGITWYPLHYAQGLVRVGVQSAIAHPETAALIKKLMAEKGLEIPPDITNSICLTVASCG